MKISIIGGGGTRTPLLVEGLLSLGNDFELQEISLMDVDKERLFLIKRILDEVVKIKGKEIILSYTQDLRESITLASFVICSIREGGDNLRVIDEMIPKKLGLLAQETMGAGGFSMAVRTIPRMLDIAKVINDYSEDAWLINFTNPSGIITQTLMHYSPLKKVVGICDAPSMIHKAIALFLGKDEEEVQLDYFGINHFGWVKGVKVNNQELLPQILEFLKNNPKLEELTKFPSEFISSLNMLPNPYNHYYYFQEEVIKKQSLEEKTRAELVKELNENLFRKLKEGGNALNKYGEYLKAREGKISDLLSFTDKFEGRRIFREGEGYVEVALRLIKGLRSEKGETVVVNVKNQNSLEGISKDEVVEISSLIQGGNIYPKKVGLIPEETLRILRNMKDYEKLVIAGVINNSYTTLVEALSVNPWVGSEKLAEALINEYLKEEPEYFSRYE